MCSMQRSYYLPPKPSPAGALLLRCIPGSRFLASLKSRTMMLQSTREHNAFDDPFTVLGKSVRPLARSTASTGTEKLLSGVSLVTRAFGITKAPRPTHFSPTKLPARPLGVNAGAEVEGEVDGNALAALFGRPTPSTTLAKCVGTAIDGGLPIILVARGKKMHPEVSPRSPQLCRLSARSLRTRNSRAICRLGLASADRVVS